jgi:hypothetical protein
VVRRQLDRLLTRVRFIHYPINRQSPIGYKRKHPPGWTGFHSPAIVNQHRNVA